MAAEGWLVVDDVEVFSNYRYKQMVEYFQDNGLIPPSNIRFNADGSPTVQPQLRRCPPLSYLSGDGYVLPGVGGNFASVPDLAAYTPTIIEVVMRFSTDSIASGSRTFFCKRSNASTALEFEVAVDAAYLRFKRSYTGTSWGVNAISSAFLTADTTYWVKVTHNPTTGATAFYSAPDSATEPTSWTARGTATSATGTPFNGTGTLNVGQIHPTLELGAGVVKRAIVRNGIGGTVVYDANFAAQYQGVTSFNESSSNAALVTLTVSSGWSSTIATSITDMPWYNAGIPESSKFIGYWVEQIDGLDPRFFEREITQKAFSGAQLSSLRSNHRELAFEFIVAGADSEGVEFGMRWLESQFVDFCSSCALSTIQLRHNEPISGSPDRGWWKYRRVGLSEGIEWDAEELDIGCRLRRASMSLVVADPCRYKCEQTVFAATEVLASGGYTPGTCMSFEDFMLGFDSTIPPKMKKKVAGVFGATQEYVYGEIPASGVGVNSAVVRLTNTTPAASASCGAGWNIWVTCSSDWPTVDEAIANRRVVMTVVDLPASGQMVIDSSTKTVSVNINGTDIDHPWQYVGFQDGTTFDWIDCSDCTNLLVGLEPLNPAAVQALFEVGFVHREGCN